MKQDKIHRRAEKTALVFAGGGARGAYEVGVWEGLEALGTRAQIVTGSSVGTLNGAMYAQGALAQARTLWSTLTTEMIFRLEDAPDAERGTTLTLKRAARALFGDILRKGGLDASPLRELLEKTIDEARVRAGRTAFGLVTVETGKAIRPRELFLEEIPKGRLIDYLMASCSLYPAIRPHEIDGVPHIDGGFHDNLPVRMALSRGASRIIAVDLEAIGFVRWGEIRRLHQVDVIRSARRLGPLLQFDPARAKVNMRLGYLDTLRHFGRLEGRFFALQPGTLREIVMRMGDLSALAARLGLSSAQELLGMRPKSEADEDAARAFCLACAESAAALFELDFEDIYSFEMFDGCVRRAAHAAAAEEASGTAQEGLLEAGAELMRTLARLRAGGARALMLARILAAQAKTDKRLPVGVLASVARQEFLGAVYLLAAGHAA